ncbi:hypothetical protein [Streptomyces sp. NBC_01751]|uniref:hypothetical protein n=1 Tax=Streptomyces sp. NBC_01751 TaxID=2975929 RepID=UPI002DDA5895|nr:hypothetical protein [Streptomyces sp. NBC_01751]WSD24563.1 hypothetical protein OHA26_14310 [Streptomyces sp. NBC_01751]
MKQFGMDLDELAEKAAKAAWLDTPTERLRALTVVFEECGERAAPYFDPRFAAKQLVRECVKEFQAERADIRKILKVKELAHV